MFAPINLAAVQVLLVVHGYVAIVVVDTGNGGCTQNKPSTYYKSTYGSHNVRIEIFHNHPTKKAGSHPQGLD
jgi:hypothetical protein